MSEQEKLESAGRRDLLKSLGLAATGLALEPFAADLPLAAAIHHHLEQKAAEPAQTGPIRPQFFQGREAETVFRLTDLILPNDGTPGARVRSAPAAPWAAVKSLWGALIAARPLGRT